MVKTFADMVAEGREVAPPISIDDAKAQLASHPETIVVDVRQEDDAHGDGIPGSVNIPLGLLAIRADTNLPEHYRDARLQVASARATGSESPERGIAIDGFAKRLRFKRSLVPADDLLFLHPGHFAGLHLLDPLRNGGFSGESHIE